MAILVKIVRPALLIDKAIERVVNFAQLQRRINNRPVTDFFADLGGEALKDNVEGVAWLDVTLEVYVPAINPYQLNQDRRRNARVQASDVKTGCDLAGAAYQGGAEFVLDHSSLKIAIVSTLDDHVAFKIGV